MLTHHHFLAMHESKNIQLEQGEELVKNREIIAK